MMATFRFLLTVAISLVVALVLVALLPVLGIARSSAEIAWVASLYADKTRIAETVNGPRILVVGGSGTLFSFDAEVATKRLGRPVVNYGTHAGLGLGYILDRAGRILRPGDVVLLAPEYEILQQQSAANEYAIQLTAFYDRAYLRRLPLTESFRYMLGYDVLPSLAVGARVALHRPPAQRTDITLDSFGDARGNTVAQSKGGLPLDSVSDKRPISGIAEAALRRFMEEAKARQVQVIAIPPALVETPASQSAVFQAFQQSRAALFTRLGIAQLGVPPDGFLPPSDMYDSVYHANDRGRARYTGRILAILCKTTACRP